MEFTQEHLLLPGTPLGDLQIRYYGIIIVTAMLVGAWIASRIARREGLDTDHIWGGLTWGIIPGIIFARLWFVLFPPISLTAGCGIEGGRCQDVAWFMQNFFNTENGAIAIWSGGLSIFGAVIGGFIGVYIYMRRNKLELGRWMDIAAVGIPIAQAIGRWANFVNQELYGPATNLPWGIQIDAAHRVGEYTSLVEYPADTLFHPLFLYESLWSILAFFVLLQIYQNYRHRLRSGDVFLIYLAQYSLIRFLLEFIRVEVAHIPGTSINSSQAITGLGFVVAVLLLVYRNRFAGDEEEHGVISEDAIETSTVDPVEAEA